MIIGLVVDSGCAKSRDHVDVSMTLRVRAAFGEEIAIMRPEDWPDLRDQIMGAIAKGNLAMMSTQEPPSEDGSEPQISPALARHMDREADRDDSEEVEEAPSDDGASVDFEMSDTGSDGWDLSDDGSDGREEDE